MDNIGKNEGSNNVPSIGKDTRSDLHSTIDRMAEKVPAATERLAAGAHTGVDRVADTINSASDKLGTKGKDLSMAYKKMAETGRSYVRDRPAVSVLVALAAGYAVSKLLGSRKH